MYGIDIGTTTIKAVRIDGDGRGRPTISKYAICPLDEGLVEGNFAKVNVRVPQDFQSALSSVCKTVGARGTPCAVTLPDQYFKLFFLHLDRLQDVTPEERRYTEWRLKQLLPPRVSEGCVIDYQVLSTVRGPDGVQIRLAVQLIREDILNAFAEALVEAGTIPAFFNCDSMATLNFHHDVIRPIREEAGGSDCCLIHIGNYSTTFSFLRNETLEYVRILDYACQNFVNSLASLLDIPPEQARQRLGAGGLIPGSLPAEEAVLDRLGQFHQIFEEWFREIGSTFAYYRTHHPALGSIPVFLAGGGSALANLCPFLEQLLEQPVLRLDPKRVADMPALSSGEDPALLVPAAGIALTFAHMRTRTATESDVSVEALAEGRGPLTLPTADGPDGDAQ